MLDTFYKMDCDQIRMCFICNEEVWNNGTILNVGKTTCSNTPFPAKISQLIGDAFMVVVSEKDKLCVRCTTLVNKSDKLQTDLTKVNQVIVKLLSIKYNLDDEAKEDEDPLQDLDLSNEENSSEPFDPMEYLPARSSCQSNEFLESPANSADNIRSLQNSHNEKGNGVVKIKSGQLNCKYFDEGKNIDTIPNVPIKNEDYLEKNTDDSIRSETINSQVSLVGDSCESDKSKVRKFAATAESNSKKLKSISMQNIIPTVPKLTNLTDIASLCTVEINTQNDQDAAEQIANPSHTCKYCKCCFDNDDLLQTHLNENCVVINKHKQIHQKKKTFTCEFCGKQYKVGYRLKEHRRIHTKEFPFICEKCGKKFSYKSTYWIHRKWHENPFPYKCNECGKFFKTSSVLSVHKRRHSGERPYKCPYCTHTFTESKGLKRHVILHTKEYPFRCEICDRGFTVREKFNHHLAKVHEIIIKKPVKREYKMAVHDEIDTVLARKVEPLEAREVELVVAREESIIIEESIVESHEFYDDEKGMFKTLLQGDNEALVNEFYTPV